MTGAHKSGAKWIDEKAETEVSLIVEPNNNCLDISPGKTELTFRSSLGKGLGFQVYGATKK